LNCVDVKKVTHDGFGDAKYPFPHLLLDPTNSFEVVVIQDPHITSATTKIVLEIPMAIFFRKPLLRHPILLQHKIHL